MENKKALSALIVNALRLLNADEQAALCRALIERSEEVRERLHLFLDEMEQQEYNEQAAAAIDAGGGCSRCGDLDGFGCICEDEDEEFPEHEQPFLYYK